MTNTDLFTYSERVENAAQSFMKLKDEYLDPKDLSCSFRNLIAKEWQVKPLDLDVRVWEINNQTNNRG